MAVLKAISAKRLVIALVLAPICIALVTGQLSGVQWSFPSEQRVLQTTYTYATFTTTTQTQTTTTTGQTQTQTTITTTQTQTTTTTSQTQTTTTWTFATSPTTTTSIMTTTATILSPVTSTPSLSPPRCVIATAAYGSTLAPEVVYMRYVRDQLISSTPSGRTLVGAFNMFYYSWSPPVAEWIAGNGVLMAVFRLLLLPLVGIVHVTALSFKAIALVTGQTDLASVLAFYAAAVMTITVYVALPIVVVAKSKQTIRALNARFRL